jgi:hypothetical protein
MSSKISNAVFVFLCALVQTAGAAEYPDPERFRTAIDEFAADASANPPAPGGIVATGSSSMRGWHPRITQDLAPIRIIPRGFGGSNMRDVRYFIDELVLRYKPRAVMLYEGDNDIAEGIAPEIIAEEFLAIATEIHSQLPNTRIYVLAIKPSIARWHMWPDMVQTNDALEKACSLDPRMTYIDVATPMLNSDGEPLENIFVADQLHMNDAGYDIWRDTVRPVLLEAEADHE